MTSWNPHNPCSVGELALPAQFQPVVWWIHCHTTTGHPMAWIHLPAELVLSLGCEVEQGEEVELWHFGPLSLTRPMSEAERAEWEADYDPTPW